MKKDSLWKIIVGITIPAVYLIRAESVIQKKVDMYRFEEKLFSIAKTHNLYEAILERSL